MAYTAKAGAALFTVTRPYFIDLFRPGMPGVTANYWQADVDILLDPTKYGSHRIVRQHIGEYRTEELARQATEKWAGKKVTWGELKNDHQHGWCYGMLTRGRQIKAVKDRDLAERKAKAEAARAARAARLAQ